MHVVVARKNQFVPKFNGNKKLPTGEQVVVSYRNPSLELRRKLLRYDMKWISNKKGDYNVESVGMPDEKEVLEGMVTGFTGLTYPDENDESVHIKTVKDLYAAPPEFQPLAKELYDFFSEELRGKDDTAKN